VEIFITSIFHSALECRNGHTQILLFLILLFVFIIFLFLAYICLYLLID
jgi:hypothetical protein